jgi:transposase
VEDKELYARLLNVKRPWFVREVRYAEKPERIDVYLDHPAEMKMPCPECGKEHAVYDHAEERQFQHLNTCHVATFLHVRMPRVKCGEHGVRRVHLGFAEGRTDMTLRMERHVIELARQCSMEGIGRLTGLSWDRCWAVVERAVKRGRQRKGVVVPRRIGVDEKSFAKGHQYETLVCDLDEGTIEYVADKNNEESLAGYYRQFTEDQRAQIEAVAMDMWDPYIAATKAAVPEADKKIVFDKFHVTRVLCEAVDKVRKEEHKELMAEGKDWLKWTKYLWLRNEENVPEDRRSEIDLLRQLDVKVARAWAIKENFRNFWRHQRIGWAVKFFKRWYHWATHSRLKPIIAAAKTIQRHLANILTYLRHGITNGLTEAINSNIEKVKRMACGFRNREHYRTAIYFHCGGLDVYPKSPRFSTATTTS